MDKELNEINDTFQSGKHKQAINELETLIDKFQTDSLLHKAYDLLGDYLNFMGQHIQAVQSWNNALKTLENSPGGVDQLTEQKFFDWINISVTTARTMYRQGKDGSGVSHKYNTVSFTGSKMNQSEEEEWKKEQFQTAIEYYKRVIDKIPASLLETKRKINIELAEVLFDAKHFDEAVQIYEEAFNNDGNPQWLYKAADCSWQQDKKEQAYVRLQQLIATEPKFANAYKMCAEYFIEKNDRTNADECTRQYQFYSWIPTFCDNIEYNQENISILEALQSDKALECIDTTLTLDTSKRSIEFLASICYHHYHGRVENRAFEQLEKRGKECEDSERDFIGSILMYLIKHQQSVCTVKGAASALAGLKYNGVFEVLENLLPQDLNLFFPMHIPKALAKLADERAIPLLVKMIEEPIKIENDDSDSSDGLFSSGGSGRLVVESCIALASFISDSNVKEVLLDGINNEKTREACLAVLCVCTEEEEFFEKLEKILIEGDTLDYMVAEYLEENIDKSQYANTLFNLNKEIYTKKQKENNDDND